MGIRTVKDAAKAIEDLQGQIHALEDELALAKAHKHPKPPTPTVVDLSGIEANIESLQAGISVLADQVTELVANPPAPDVDTLIRIISEKAMLRMR